MNNKYYSAPQQRVASFVMALVGHEATGLTSIDIAKAARASSAEATKTLDNLMACGWVEKHPTNSKTYRLSAMFSQIANTIQVGLRSAVLQLDQDQSNFNRLY